MYDCQPFPFFFIARSVDPFRHWKSPFDQGVCRPGAGSNMSFKNCSAVAGGGTAVWQMMGENRGTFMGCNGNIMVSQTWKIHGILMTYSWIPSLLTAIGLWVLSERVPHWGPLATGIFMASPQCHLEQGGSINMSDYRATSFGRIVWRNPEKKSH